MKSDLSSLPDDVRLSKQDIASLIEAIDQKYQEKIHYLEERIRLLQTSCLGKRVNSAARAITARCRFLVNWTIRPIQSQHHRTRSLFLPTSGASAVANRCPRICRASRSSTICPKSKRLCACGAKLSRIGHETCEKLDYIPAKVQVIRHVRYKYACKSCEGVEDDGPTVKIAPAPVQLIEKSNATEGLLAHIVVSKFADALPLYRQQKMFARLGVDLSTCHHGQLAGAGSPAVQSLDRIGRATDPGGPFDPDGRNAASGLKRARPEQHQQILHVGLLRWAIRSPERVVPVSSHPQW